MGKGEVPCLSGNLRMAKGDVLCPFGVFRTGKGEVTELSSKKGQTIEPGLGAAVRTTRPDRQDYRMLREGNAGSSLPLRACVSCFRASLRHSIIYDNR
jgi:hypothetical protein